MQIADWRGGEREAKTAIHAALLTSIRHESIPDHFVHALSSMNAKADELKARTKRFALDALRFLRTLPPTDEAKTIGRQLLRSATGVAANYRSACRSRSRAEFIARIGVALDEADESALWFEILVEARIACAADARRLLQESDELSAIFAQSSLTAQRAVPQSATRGSTL